MFADRLASLLDVTLHHDALYEAGQVTVGSAGMHDLVNDADLFLELFAGVAVICVDDTGRIDEIALVVFLQQENQIFIVIIGNIVAMLVDCAAQDCVRERISGRIDLPAAVDKRMRVLCRVHGVEHDAEVSACGVLHPGGYVEAADDEAVLLVFHGAGADRDVGEKIAHISPVLRIEHLISRGEFRFIHDAQLHFAHCDNAF